MFRAGSTDGWMGVDRETTELHPGKPDSGSDYVLLTSSQGREIVEG